MTDETLPGTEPAPDETPQPVIAGSEVMVAAAMGLAADAIRLAMIFRTGDDVPTLAAADAVWELVRQCLPVAAGGFDLVCDRLRAASPPPAEEEAP